MSLFAVAALVGAFLCLYAFTSDTDNPIYAQAKAYEDSILSLVVPSDDGTPNMVIETSREEWQSFNEFMDSLKKRPIHFYDSQKVELYWPKNWWEVEVYLSLDTVDPNGEFMSDDEEINSHPIHGTQIGERVFFIDPYSGGEKFIFIDELTTDPRNTITWQQEVVNSDYTTLWDAIAKAGELNDGIPLHNDKVAAIIFHMKELHLIENEYKMTTEDINKALTAYTEFAIYGRPIGIGSIVAFD